MSPSARSVFVFGIYVALLGLLLLVVPNPLLGVFRVPPTTEVWVRVAGLLLVFLGFYYVMAARAGFVPFFRWTVWCRSLILPAFAVFVAAGLAPPVLVAFGLVDLGGALWTHLALRSESGNRKTV